MKRTSMAQLAVILILAIGARFVVADCVTFVDGDANPVFTMDSETHAVTFTDSAIAAFNCFDCLAEDAPLPPDLSFLAKESGARYAVLGLTAPKIWTARYVREVFRSRGDLIAFLDRHFSSSTTQ